MRGADGGVSAQIHFDFGREPAQLVVRSAGDVEGGFGEIMFGRNGLQGGVGEPRFERTNDGGIAGKQPV